MTVMLVKLDAFDGLLPGAAATQELQMRALRQVQVTDGGEYWLCELMEPLALDATMASTPHKTGLFAGLLSRFRQTLSL